MGRYPILQQRLNAAKARRDKFLAEEVERGSRESGVKREAEKRVPEEPKPSADAEPKVSEDDGIPEVREEDGEEIESPMKKSRVGESQSQRSAHSQVDEDDLPDDVEGSTGDANVGATVAPEGDEPDEDDDEPKSKRVRTATMSVERKILPKKIRWADLADEEDDETCKCSRHACDDCSKDFASRNQLYAHVRTDCCKNAVPRSDADGLACAEDGSPGRRRQLDELRQPHPETSTRRTTSKFDVCEVFSPARVTSAAVKHGLRGVGH